jgi:hypothetical protein
MYSPNEDTNSFPFVVLGRAAFVSRRDFFAREVFAFLPSVIAMPGERSLSGMIAPRLAEDDPSFLSEEVVAGVLEVFRQELNDDIGLEHLPAD